MITVLHRCLLALLFYGAWSASGRVIPRITLSAEAPAPGPVRQLSAKQVARTKELLAALGPASAPAQGPLPSGQVSVEQQAALDAVVESYMQGAQATAPAESLTAAVEKAERAAAATTPAPVTAAPMQQQAAQVAPASTPLTIVASAPQQAALTTPASAPSVAATPSQQQVIRTAPATAPLVAVTPSQQQLAPAALPVASVPAAGPIQQRMAPSAPASAPLAVVEVAPASGPFMAAAPFMSSRNGASGAMQAYQQGVQVGAPSDSLSAAQRSAAREAFASAPAASETSSKPAEALPGGAPESYNQGVPTPGPVPLLSAAQQQAARDAFASDPAETEASTPPSRVPSGGAIEAYNHDETAPVQTSSKEQQDASRAIFVPMAAVQAVGPSAQAVALAATAPQPAIELTPAEQEAIRAIFLNNTRAAKEDYAPAPEPAIELTPAQREAIRKVFLNSTAGKEDYEPAQAPQPAVKLTPEQQRQIRAIFLNSTAPVPAPATLPPSSAPSAELAPAPTPVGAGWYAMAPGFAATGEAADMAKAGEAAPAAWPQAAVATRPEGGSAALVQAPQRAPAPALQRAVALQRPLAAAAPGPASLALVSAAARAPNSDPSAAAMAPSFSFQSFADTSKSTDNGLPNIKAAASQVQSFLTHGANSSFGSNTTFVLPSPHQNGTVEAKAIGNLVATSVQLGADLAASGHAVSLAAEERANFVEKLKGDFENLSIAIADLPVGLIPFPDRAKVALQKLNTDVVHGVSSGNLDVDAIALDNRDVQSALGGAMAAGQSAAAGNMQ